jgi:hypothetical protein
VPFNRAFLTRTDQFILTVPDLTVSTALALPKTMDDSLEQPKPFLNIDHTISGETVEDREQDASDDEDGGLDWTKLPYVLLRYT